MYCLNRSFAATLAVALAGQCLALADDKGSDFLGRLKTTTTIASTVPPNGDVNPYGIVVVPATVGNLTQGDILVSNFNNSQNLQGTGTTIVDIAPSGSLKVFAQIDASNLPGPCTGGVGLTTALGWGAFEVEEFFPGRTLVLRTTMSPESAYYAARHGASARGRLFFQQGLALALMRLVNDVDFAPSGGITSVLAGVTAPELPDATCIS